MRTRRHDQTGRLCAAGLFFALASASAAETDQEAFAGSLVCSGCHVGIGQRQQRSSHARSLHRAHEHPLASAFLSRGAAERKIGYQARFYRTANGLRIRVLGPDGSIHLPLDWAFGAGVQGVTFVSRLDDAWYLELGLSFYPLHKDFGVTPGHPEAAESLSSAIGLPYAADRSANGVWQCFDCHSTGPVALNLQGEERVFEFGVTCESCHGPARAHAENAARIERPPTDPNSLIALCAQCHRRPRRAESIDWNDPWNVRHAPAYLVQSACYQGDLSCLDCHDPHDDSGQTRETSNAACVACHKTAHQAHPVDGDCVRCHMPKVRPTPQLTFTNHWIGVYGQEHLLRPLNRLR